MGHRMSNIDRISRKGAMLANWYADERSTAGRAARRSAPDRRRLACRNHYSARLRNGQRNHAAAPGHSRAKRARPKKDDELCRQ